MKRIVPRAAAERDIDEATDYYSVEAGEEVGHRFVEAVREAYRTIAEHPGTGSPRYAELLGIEGLRSRRLSRFPFLVFYVERREHIDIWRVLHAQRDIPAQLRQGDADRL